MATESLMQIRRTNTNGLVNTQEKAEQARDSKPEWYSSGYSTPIRDVSWELEVIMVDLRVFRV